MNKRGKWGKLNWKVQEIRGTEGGNIGESKSGKGRESVGDIDEKG